MCACTECVEEVGGEKYAENSLWNWKNDFSVSHCKDIDGYIAIHFDYYQHWYLVSHSHTFTRLVFVFVCELCEPEKRNVVGLFQKLMFVWFAKTEASFFDGFTNVRGVCLHVYTIALYACQWTAVYFFCGKTSYIIILYYQENRLSIICSKKIFWNTGINPTIRHMLVYSFVYFWIRSDRQIVLYLSLFLSLYVYAQHEISKSQKLSRIWNRDMHAHTHSLTDRHEGRIN